ncbi:MAG: S8/S53 family peptidase [Micromonosporaceae bacterium]|nr:S8/S53 family peptidase [Micromonosporaceae bacterium]
MPPSTSQHAQYQQIVDSFGEAVAPGPHDWEQTGVHYLHEASHLLVREEYLDAVASALAAHGTVCRPRVRPTVRGVVLVELSQAEGDRRAPLGCAEALRLVETGEVPGREGRVSPLGHGVVAPNHLIGICETATICPANEPSPVPPGTAPYPGRAADPGTGEGVKVVVADTGLDHATAARTPWLTGVTGDPDPGVHDGTIDKYAGHGTFIAGVLRCVAPAATVQVRNVFPPRSPIGNGGFAFESDVVPVLEDILRNDEPDIISLSAGTWAQDNHILLTIEAFFANRLRHHKGVLLVSAAGNDHFRKPFWPAAAPFAVSVGALGTTWREHAEFTAFGGWVDVYAPGTDLVNAFPSGTYTYREPPNSGSTQFQGMARWSGTSFSTPVVAGLVAARMSRTGENGVTAAARLLDQARAQAKPGVGAVLVP